MSTEIIIEPGEEYIFQLGGRQVHLWAHDCEACTSVDVWTDRGREVEEVSTNTGDKTRAPTGVALWRNGQRPRTPGTALPGTHGWPAVGSVNLIWDDEQ